MNIRTNTGISGFDMFRPVSFFFWLKGNIGIGRTTRTLHSANNFRRRNLSSIFLYRSTPATPSISPFSRSLPKSQSSAANPRPFLAHSLDCTAPESRGYPIKTPRETMLSSRLTGTPKPQCIRRVVMKIKSNTSPEDTVKKSHEAII